LRKLNPDNSLITVSIVHKKLYLAHGDERLEYNYITYGCYKGSERKSESKGKRDRP
jgi:hypothetical protein